MSCSLRSVDDRSSWQRRPAQGRQPKFMTTIASTQIGYRHCNMSLWRGMDSGLHTGDEPLEQLPILGSGSIGPTSTRQAATLIARGLPPLGPTFRTQGRPVAITSARQAQNFGAGALRIRPVTLPGTASLS